MTRPQKKYNNIPDNSASVADLSETQAALIKRKRIANAIAKIQAGKTISKREEELIAEASLKKPSKPPMNWKDKNHTWKTKAAKLLGVRMEALTMAQEHGCTAFLESGRVNIKRLKAFLDANPDIIEATKDLPDARLEKALKLRAERKRAELEYEQSIGAVVSMSKVQPMIMALAKMVRAKLRQIPDRCSQKYSMMTEALEIKDDLKNEIDGALRAMADFDINEFMKEVLQEAAE